MYCINIVLTGTNTHIIQVQLNFMSRESGSFDEVWDLGSLGIHQILFCGLVAGRNISLDDRKPATGGEVCA